MFRIRRLLATALLGAAIALSAGLSRPARAELDGDRFRSEEWRVLLSGPKGWHLSEHSPYPNILLWMVRRHPEATMLFAAEKLDEVRDTQSYSMTTVKSLEKLGFSVRAPQLHSVTGAYWMDFDDGEHFLRQAVLVRHDEVTGEIYGYSLTLSTGDLRTRGQMLRAFDYTLRSLRAMRGAPVKEQL